MPNDDSWELINPRWLGRTAIITPSGRKALLLTEETVTMGEINEISISLDEAFARAALRSSSDALRQPVSEVGKQDE